MWIWNSLHFTFLFSLCFDGQCTLKLLLHANQTRMFIHCLFCNSHLSEMLFLVDMTTPGLIRGFWGNYQRLQTFYQCLHMIRWGFYDECYRFHDKIVIVYGIERPNNKALYLGRTVGMNRGESFGIPKTDRTQMPEHKCQITMLRTTMKRIGVASAKLHRRLWLRCRGLVEALNG